MRSILALCALAVLGGPASAVTFEWVMVGQPDNAPDAAENCMGAACGSVPYVYEIAKHEVTQAQYVEFLNAKAASDPRGLFNPLMQSEEQGGITRAGSPGSYVYTAKDGFANKPVNYVSFYDALRFVNWLQNGQGDGDTETGAYTLTVQGIQDNTVAREPGAAFAVTSENEWYKAAYFHGAGYYDYPAGSDSVIGCAAPTAAPNRANCNSAAGGVADVGSYPGSASPWGTLDQGGNFFEWTEAAEGAARSLRGGGWGSADFALAASYWEQALATTEFGIRIGFRPVRLAPEPTGAAWASVSGLAVLAAGRRRRARAAPRRGGREG